MILVKEKQGTSQTTRMIFGWLSTERRNALDSFCSECGKREYTKFTDLENALMFIPLPVLNDEDKLALSHYSGFSYFSLNRAIKGKWNYEENGHISLFEERKRQAEELSKAISNNQSSVGNIKVYRGVPLKYFRDYGINTIDDLESLEGNYLLDEGFVSTSLVEEECFYRKNPGNGVNYNVMIEYLIPEEFTDGICNVGESHFINESEYLINTWSLAEVTSVKCDGEDRAIIQALLVPKKVYDEYYAREAGVVK